MARRLGRTAVLAVATAGFGAVNAANVPAPPADAAPPSAASPESPAPAHTVIEHGGQSFVLASSTVVGTVETAEYVLQGEKIAHWNQLVTVQRLKLAKSAAADELLAYFKQRIQSEEGASLETLKSGAGAAVFAVRFPASDRNDEQVMVCLAFVGAESPRLLNIVQFAIKPTRVPLATVETQLRLWRDKFLRQAGALAGG